MENIKRLNKKTVDSKGVSDVCDIMNEFLNANLKQKNRYTFVKIEDSVLSISGFHNNSLTAPIYALAYIIDTEVDINILYTGITTSGITFNKSFGNTWSDVYKTLLNVL